MDTIQVLTRIFNMVEDCLASDDSRVVKTEICLLASDMLDRAVIARAVPVGCAEIILDHWVRRLKGDKAFTCHAVTTLEARHQFAVRPKRKVPANPLFN